MRREKRNSRTFSLLLSSLLLTTQPLHAEDGVAAASPFPGTDNGGSPNVDTAPPSVVLPAEQAPVLPPEAAVVPPPAVEVIAPANLAAAVPSRDAQGLEYEAHRLLAVAGVLADERSIPVAHRLDLYIRQTGLGRGSVESLQYAIDDAPAVTVDFSAAQAKALSDKDSPLRIARLPIPAGAQRLQVLLRLAKAGEAEARRLSAEFPLDRASGPIELAALFDTGTLTGASLRLQRAMAREAGESSLLGIDFDGLIGSAGRYRPGDDHDPALGHARKLLQLDDSSGALVELLSIAERRRLPNGSLPTFEAPYWLETARLLRQEGLLDRAQQICDDLSPRRAIRAAVAIERLALGEARLAIGDLTGAEKQLTLAQPHLPEFRQPDLRSALGMLQLAQKRSREATATLNTRSPESIEAFRYMLSSTEAVRATAYSRYNLAIATLRNGDVQMALSWLDLLGRTESNDPELLSLRDKANLALGWHFLQQKQGRTALGVLGRIRSEGLASNRALLGMGWAQLAPAGERLKRPQLGDNSARSTDQISDLPAPVRNSLERLRVLEPEVNGSWLGPSSFERDDPPKDRREGLQRALQIWDVLVVRDERDPAVQEAKLAVAYAHDQLREGAEARVAYAVAIESLRKVDAAIDTETAYATGGALRNTLTTMTDQAALFGMLDQLHLPPEESTFPLYAKLDRLQQRNRLQQTLTEARQRLEQPSEAGPTVSPDLFARLNSFETWLSRQRSSMANEAETTIKTRLNARRTTTRDYLKTALLSLARLEDTPNLDSRGAVPEAPACEGASCP